MKTALSAKIGKKIKEKRLELKLTIHEVSNEINLTEKFLKAIENGDYSIFPAKAFARGYFVKYTTHLGLDLEFPELANEVFEEDKLLQSNQSAKRVKAKSINDVMASYKKPLLVAGIILFLLLIPINAFALIEVDITRGNLNPLPIAVSPLSIDEKSRKSFERSQRDC